MSPRFRLKLLSEVNFESCENMTDAAAEFLARSKEECRNNRVAQISHTVGNTLSQSGISSAVRLMVWRLEKTCQKVRWAELYEIDIIDHKV